MRVRRGGGVWGSGGFMDRRTDEVRLLIGMAGVALATVTLLLAQIWESGPAIGP